jgi:hypothetical protein
VGVVVIYNTNTKGEFAKGRHPDPDNQVKKEKTMLKVTLQAVASGFAALALVTMLSWTFLDATAFANNSGNGSATLHAISVLVR